MASNVSSLDLTPQGVIKVSPQEPSQYLGSSDQSLLILLHMGQSLWPFGICSASEASLLPSSLPEPYLCEISGDKRAPPSFPTP